MWATCVRAGEGHPLFFGGWPIQALSLRLSGAVSQQATTPHKQKKLVWGTLWIIIADMRLSSFPVRVATIPHKQRKAAGKGGLKC
jgi:hypothetical protein